MLELRRGLCQEGVSKRSMVEFNPEVEDVLTSGHPMT